MKNRSSCCQKIRNQKKINQNSHLIHSWFINKQSGSLFHGTCTSTSVLVQEKTKFVVCDCFWCDSTSNCREILRHSSLYCGGNEWCGRSTSCCKTKRKETLPLCLSMKMSERWIVWGHSKLFHFVYWIVFSMDDVRVVSTRAASHRTNKLLSAVYLILNIKVQVAAISQIWSTRAVKILAKKALKFLMKNIQHYILWTKPASDLIMMSSSYFLNIFKDCHWLIGEQHWGIFIKNNNIIKQAAIQKVRTKKSWYYYYDVQA